MIIVLALLALFSQDANPLPSDDSLEGVEVAVFIELSELEPGARGELTVDLYLGDGVDASMSGMPAPVIQLDVPPAVRLLGRYLETHEELAANEFLQEPYERLMKENPFRVPFELQADPQPGDRIGINVLGYLRLGGRERFLRRRVEVPIALEAEGVNVSARRSTWGPDERLLQIGDRAVDFTLPRAEGDPFTLSTLLGERNVIVMTYRAFW